MASIRPPRCREIAPEAERKAARDARPRGFLAAFNPRASEFTRIWDPRGAYLHHHRSASQAFR